MTEETTICEIITGSPDETRSIGKNLAGYLKGGEIILLNGPLGVGKTVFVQGMALGLGIPEHVKSPSFVLERIYRGRLTLHHFDFYRISQEDVDEAGFLLDLDESSVTVIEWASRIFGFDGWTLSLEMTLLPKRQGEDEPRRRIIIETRVPFWREKLLRLKEGVDF